MPAESPLPCRALKTDMKNNIVLIGMPSAGKSTLGVILAKTLGKQFVDTDLLIQKHTGETLQETINRDGIKAFLEIEETVVASAECDNSVVATGGSVVFSEKAMDKLKENGTVVYLDVPLSDIKRRLNNITTRGIAMNPNETIETVYEQRLPLYRKYADITVPAADNDFEQTVEKIIKSLF